MNFNKALKMVIENETVTLYEQEETIQDDGSSAIEWINKGSLLCNIQKQNAQRKSGETVENTNTGDEVSEALNLRCRKPIKNQQRIKRDNGLVYEIRSAFRNGRNTILEHYQATLIRVRQ